MLPQSKARIFLSAERPAIQSDKYRSYNGLQSGTKEEENNFGAIVSFNEITLAGAESIIVKAQTGIYSMLVPLVGTIHFENTDDDSLVNPGQALFSSIDTKITNPYPDELVNYLQISFQSKTKLPTMVSCFDIDSHKNELVGIAGEVYHPKISIGKFDGRKELLVKLRSKGHGVFVHVITGAFEVQYRLLEAKDSLFVWDAETLDLESLSNEAIILLIETPLTAQEV